MLSILTFDDMAVVSSWVDILALNNISGENGTSVFRVNSVGYE
jgi:hypothetical protein